MNAVKNKALVLGILLSLFAQVVGFAQQSAESRGVYSAPSAQIDSIIDEGMNRSQVIKHIHTLTEVIGPRLTNSPGARRAEQWTSETLKSWGLDVRLEPFGPWGRGWSYQHASVTLTKPGLQQLSAFPNAWSPSTNGPITAEVVHLKVDGPEDVDKFKGQLKGKIVLMSPARELKNDPKGLGGPFSDEELLNLENYVKPEAVAPRATPSNDSVNRIVTLMRTQVLIGSERPLVVIEASQRGSGGAVMVHSAMPFPSPTLDMTGVGGGPWNPAAEKFLIPQLTMANEDYNRLVRLAEGGSRPELTVDVKTTYHDEDLNSYNVIAEIPGTDPVLKNEVVMLGAHLDSWHIGTGATDNASGVGVVMEAVRIILASGLKPRRTIRVALWGAEEQGLHGSKAYVENHFGKLPTKTKENPNPTIEKKAGYENLSVYFNIDNGAGKIRGIYLMENELVRPIFDEWFKPFYKMGAQTTTLMARGSTDHVSFNAIGLPGFGFMQDPNSYSLDFGMRTHHTNQDTFDRIVPENVKQSATIMAAFVYQASMMDQRMSRKTP